MTGPRQLGGSRRLRGAALVEAVVLLPVLVVLLAASLYVAGYHAKQQLLLRSVRRAAWEHALGGCQGAHPAVQTRADGPASAWLSTRGVVLPTQTAGHIAQAGGLRLAGNLGSAQAEAQAHILAEPLVGIEGSELSFVMRLPCNERPRSASLAAALRLGWQQVRVW